MHVAMRMRVDMLVRLRLMTVRIIVPVIMPVIMMVRRMGMMVMRVIARVIVRMTVRMVRMHIDITRKRRDRCWITHHEPPPPQHCIPMRYEGHRGAGRRRQCGHGGEHARLELRKRVHQCRREHVAGDAANGIEMNARGEFTQMIAAGVWTHALNIVRQLRPCANAPTGATYNHMVAHSLSDEQLDRLFRALGDATRRDIVARLQAGEAASVSSLAARYDMSFAAVQKHVAVLEQAGLVRKEAQGRERIVRSNPERLAQARTLLLKLEQLWISRFNQLDQVLLGPKRSRD